MIYDLHSHSYASDGALSPEELVVMAKEQQIDCLALTDHDGIDGIKQAQEKAKEISLPFINGIELSVTYGNTTVHIVGLDINIDSPALLAGIAQLRDFRSWRAQEISKGLAQSGIDNALAGAQRHAKGNMIGRMHFSQFLIDQGHAKDHRAVFKKFLVKNKPGHVSGQWAKLEDAVSWIVNAGGIAVIAHPVRYKMKRSAFKQMVKEFKAYGGQAIEVVSGNMATHEIEKMTRFANDNELYASIGSDFHDPNLPWNRLGSMGSLPKSCSPVWQLFNQ